MVEEVLQREQRAPSLFNLYGGQALWFPVLALMSFGLLFVYSASSVYSSQKFGDEYMFVKKQLIYVIPGFVAALMGMRISLRWIDRWGMHIYFFALFTSALTRVPGIGKKVGGAARWLSVGPFSFQPSEFLKIATVILVTALLAKNPRNLTQLWPALTTFVILIIQPDFGSTVIIALAMATIVLIHGVPKRLFVLGIVSSLPILIGMMIAAPYRIKRLVTYLDPFADPLGAGFQVIQSFVAVANGGWFGKGLGASQQKLFFLPEAHTDFILAVIGEEMGFSGIFIIALIYLLLFYTMMQILKSAASHRERLLASGFFSMMAGSAIINMGVVVGLFPTKGLPLPFISAGGSSLIANLFMIGLIAQIHKTAVERNAHIKIKG